MSAPRQRPDHATHRGLGRLAVGAALVAGTTLVAGAAAAQTVTATLVVPGAAPVANANETFALPGFPDVGRVQILVDAQHLAPLVGQQLLGVRFRQQRYPYPRAFASGSAMWTVSLSIAAVAAAQAEPAFASNMGAVPIAPPSQLVQAPASTGTLVPPWSPSNSLQANTQPFLYTGGTLCIDIAGRPGPAPVDWPVDAILFPRTASAQPVGPGCGSFGGGNWSFVEPETLVVGATTHFSAIGSPGGIGMLLLDTAAVPFAFHLAAIGAGPGCWFNLSGSVLTLLAPFSAPIIPTDPSVGGLAVLAVEIPRAPAFVGAAFADQWIDASQQPFASSPAHQWQISGTVPNSGLALVQSGTATATSGEVLLDFAPVLQLLY